MMRLINCISIKNRMIEEMKEELADLQEVHLCIVQVEGDKSSDVYVNNKIELCYEVGMCSTLVKLSKNVTQKELEETVVKLSNNDRINGLMIQLPLPGHLDAQRAIDLIPPHKDVDGLTTTTQGKIFTNQLDDTLIPCTVEAVLRILEDESFDLQGKKVTVVGRSQLFGNTMAQLLMRKNATVTMCHSHTSDLKKETRQADLVITAIGSPLFFDQSYFDKAKMVIDVGVNVVEVDGKRKIYGDVDYKNVEGCVQAITPVPGGVGVLTVANLLKNTIKAYKLQNNLRVK